DLDEFYDDPPRPHKYPELPAWSGHPELLHPGLWELVAESWCGVAQSAAMGVLWRVLFSNQCHLDYCLPTLCEASYHVFGWYIVVLTLFHYSEYITTAIGNPSTLALDSYLLNHSWAYGIAAIASWVEYFIERWLLPDMKKLWYVSIIGIIVCLWGEIVRKSAMLTAKTNFNHIVQTKRQDDHELVTWGAYKFFRHPSYVGWFWWSVGTQLILVNPFCVIIYTLASWSFFNERIHFEEMTLLSFFGEKYLDYQKRVGTGLPFIKGYQYIHCPPT
ncbi:S-isoprenylcysteine O-methyltransferase-like, partial [Homarus americanus]